MTVANILGNKGRNVFTLRPDQSVKDACSLLSAKKVGALIICDGGGTVVGVLSERDIVNAISQFGATVLEMPLRNFMSDQVVSCKPQDQPKFLMEVMSQRRIRHLPVIERGELIGVVSMGDLVHDRLKETETERNVLRDLAVVR